MLLLKQTGFQIKDSRLGGKTEIQIRQLRKHMAIYLPFSPLIFWREKFRRKLIIYI